MLFTLIMVGVMVITLVKMNSIAKQIDKDMEEQRKIFAETQRQHRSYMDKEREHYMKQYEKATRK